MYNKLYFVLLASALVLGSIFLLSGNARGENTDIVINEICPTGCADKDHQWVEIYNKGEDSVDMENWKFWENEQNHGLSISESSQEQDWLIEPGEYAIIAQNDLYFFEDYPDVTSTVFDSSWSTLNKSGEEIGIKSGSGSDAFIEQFTYISIGNYSLERIDPNEVPINEANWQEHPDSDTSGQKNYWHIDEGSEEPPPENQSPTAIIIANTASTVGEEITFDGSNSTDNDGSIVNYEWLIDDSSIGNEATITYTFSNSGTYNLSLTVTDDDGAIGTDNLNILITDSGEEEGETPTSTSANIIINEFVSDPVSGENEWIELYNISTSTVDLTGWTLHDGNTDISSPTSTIEANGFVVITLSSSKLNNSGDVIILKNTEEEIIDQVSYGDWGDGNTDDNAPAVNDPNSVARAVDGQDTDNDQNDFAETTTPTKGSPNIITAPIIETPSGGGDGGGGSSSPPPMVNYNPSDVVINELVSDPADDVEEFIELFNNTESIITLDGWWIEDGSETKTNLSGNITSKGFFVIEKPSGNLNNSGDIVILYDPAGKEIDRVTYGSWDDGNLADNAPTPDDPLSLIRKVDGQDADNDYYDFVLTGTITKGQSNILTSTTKDGEIIEQVTGSSNIIINEVLPNPKGTDNEDEFIELKNIGTETVSLVGWKLGDSSSKRYEIKQGSIKPEGYIIFKRSMTGIALNNTGGDEVKLFSSNNALINQTKYNDSAGEDESYSRREDGSWAWSTKITPGKENIVEGKSAAPIINIDVDTEVAVSEAILFDASDTTDPDGDEMIFSWDFDDGKSDEGDVVEHRFAKEGVYSVTLTVSDSQGNNSEKQVVITVKTGYDFVGGYLSTDDVSKIEISEIVPNPEGSDTTEFIELYNPTDEDIDLGGLKLDDEEGGSRAYTIPDETIIKAGEYKIFARQDTKLALNNTSDSVRLLYPDGTIIKEIRFDDVEEGAAYIQDENENWIWSGSLTPGKENDISLLKTASTKRTVTKSKSNLVKPIIQTTLEKIRDEDVGDTVKVTGVVAVLPDVYGTQYFYIVGPPTGVQVYMYKKDFPKLAIGDRIEVTGEISQVSGETRLKTSQKSDIQKIDHVGIPQAKAVEASEVGEPTEGWLVQINGEITELKGSYMYIDDGSEEVKVYFKRGANINKKILQEGDIVSVTGIVQQTKNGYQLLPRSQEDIVKTGIVEEVMTKLEQEKEDEQKDMAEKYLTATAGGLTSILFGLMAKTHGSRAKGIFKGIKNAGLFIVRRKRK